MKYRVTLMLPYTYEVESTDPVKAGSDLLATVLEAYKDRNWDRSASYNKGILLRPFVHSVTRARGDILNINSKKST